MRRNRIILLVLWILSVLSISFYGGSVSYGFFMVMTLIPVVSLLYLLCVIVQFKIYQKMDMRNLIAGTTSTFYFTLQNEGLMAFAGIRVLFYSTFSTIAGLDDQTEYELLPHTGVRRQTRMVCKYRGEYDVGIKTIVAQDFLRLFTISYKNREPLRVVVKPGIVTLSELKSAKISINALQDKMRGNVPDVSIRPYVPNDDKRLIHWRASAATQTLMVREQSDERRQGIAVILNCRRMSERNEIYLPVENKMLETAIALTLYFCSHGVPAGVYYRTKQCMETDVDRKSQFDPFYEQISAVTFTQNNEDSLQYEEILHCPGLYLKHAAFLIVPEWNTATQEFARTLSMNGLAVTVYVVGAPESGTVISTEPVIPRCQVCRIAGDADLKEVL
ncbi:MAG: DUF58 domain-containing protein [Lachnospiraceae bacterium]|nr:DUF58 domain-containing protein [Lachnospiraceae bacterium]